MNDEAANALLKTLEEPPPYVVLLLLTDNPSQVLPTISSRCQPVRFDPLPAAELAERLQARGIDPGTATACARLSLGDGERALTLALTPELRAAAEAFARAPLHGRAHAERAWLPLLQQARAAGAAAKHEVEVALAEELEYLPKKEHRRRETEFTERARRAERRASTGALEHALQLIGLWYRDLACMSAGAEELVHHSDRLDALREDAALRDGTAWRAAVELVDDTRARLALNVSEELALEALAYRLES
jgi:DNA polymerase-3 subunit delta'